MALKGPLWLLGKGLEDERSRNELCHLSARLLDLGLLKTDSTRGHVFQATGAVQQFLGRYPCHLQTISNASPIEPYKLQGEELEDWKAFFSRSDGQYGREQFGYDFDTLRSYLTPKYGGTRKGGGGGNNEFEICLRLAAAHLS